MSKTKADKVEVTEYATLEVHSHCPRCGEFFEARVWVVFNGKGVAVHPKCKKAVDKARSEALEDIRKGHPKDSIEYQECTELINKLTQKRNDKKE